MDSCEDSSKMKDDSESANEQQSESSSAQRSNDIFIASGPYFAQFNGSVVSFFNLLSYPFPI